MRRILLADEVRPPTVEDMNELACPPGRERDCARITEVLERLDRYTPARAAVLLALTDETTPNLYRELASEGLPISAAAQNSHLLSYAAKLLGKDHIDREQRDYVIAPLREVGLVEKGYVWPKKKRPATGELVHRGSHLKAKSSKNCYLLTDEARKLLASADGEWSGALSTWVAGDADRRRLVLQRESRTAVSGGSLSPHANLIRAAVKALTEAKLADYTLLYIDDSDGDRISDEYRTLLENAGLTLDLHDRYPDAILARTSDRSLWIVDAITSDGEIDPVRQGEIGAWAKKHGYNVAGYTNAYAAWRDVARRQQAMKNLAVGSELWVAEDGGRVFSVSQLAK
jgi:hypothetical protein